MNNLGNLFFSSLLTLATFAAPVSAETLKVTSVGGEVLATFNQSSLEALGATEIETETPWTEGVVSFKGVSVKKILSEVDASDRDVTGLAIDDYAASLSAEVIEKYDPIVATRMNDKPMTIENKGPFWIMFDFDDIPSEMSIEMRSLAVWHLNELELE